jgi:hypothetical protein
MKVLPGWINKLKKLVLNNLIEKCHKLKMDTANHHCINNQHRIQIIELYLRKVSKKINYGWEKPEKNEQFSGNNYIFFEYHCFSLHIKN